MRTERAEEAARNNALWCETVCRAHGSPGEFDDHLWLNRHPTPRFHPNAVTLSRSTGVATQLARIRDLIALEIPGDWAVKDSFCTLDLGSNFRLLFQAAWLWRSPSLPLPDRAVPGVRWSKVHGPAELAEWEAAWSGLPAEAQLTAGSRVFLPPLLADEDVVFVAAYRQQRVIAGAIANRTGNVVGVSNVFAPAEEASLFWVGCVAAIADAFPGLPLVGYEQGREVEIAQALGFEILEPLRVWAHTRQA